MAKKAKILEIIRDVGAPKPEKIKLIGLLESPTQDLLFFSLSNNRAQCSILQILAEQGINIRFISTGSSRNSYRWMKLCTDPLDRSFVRGLTGTRAIAQYTEHFSHLQGVRILSLYPFKGNPKIAKYLFETLLSEQIEIFATNTASSVISCVIDASKLPQAKKSLRSIFAFD